MTLTTNREIKTMNQAKDKEQYIKAWQDHVKQFNTIQNVFIYNYDDESLEELKAVQVKLFALIDKAAGLEFN